MEGVFIADLLLEETVAFLGVDWFCGVDRIVSMLGRGLMSGVSSRSTRDESFEGEGAGSVEDCYQSRSLSVTTLDKRELEGRRLTSVTGVFPLRRADLRGAIFALQKEQK
jgi:hypothetical protein